MNDLMNRIQCNLPEFSKGQRLIARYITEHYDKAAFMTASRLGATVGVSESTVVRFATELGYDGYPHLQKTLQEMIRNRLTAVQRMEVTNDRMGNRDVLQTVLSADVEKIRMTLDEIDREAFQSAVEAISNANRIYILGVRSSSAPTAPTTRRGRLSCARSSRRSRAVAPTSPCARRTSTCSNRSCRRS